MFSFPTINYSVYTAVIKFNYWIWILQYYGINSNIYNWIENWLTRRSQSVVLNAISSHLVLVQSGVPQGTCPLHKRYFQQYSLIIMSFSYNCLTPKLEKVQYRAARWALNDYGQCNSVISILEHL